MIIQKLLKCVQSQAVAANWPLAVELGPKVLSKTQSPTKSLLTDALLVEATEAATDL